MNDPHESPQTVVFASFFSRAQPGLCDECFAVGPVILSGEPSLFPHEMTARCRACFSVWEEARKRAADLGLSLKTCSWRIAAKALESVVFLPGSWDKRFARDLRALADEPEARITAKQFAQLAWLLHRYRRQIG